MKKKVLVTGASGFIGSFLVEGGLKRGMQVWAGVRKSSSRKYLQEQDIRFAVLDFTDSDHLAEQLQKHKLEHGGWDYIIHCAGVTKWSDKADFEMEKTTILTLKSEIIGQHVISSKRWSAWIWYLNGLSISVL